VFAVALHQEDFLTFHGSAVALGDAAVAFLAPSSLGKSTTAAALVDSGGRFLADDLVAVWGRLAPAVVPNAPVRRLWEERHESDSPVPLAALYLLAPCVPGEAGQVSREPLSRASAAAALLGAAQIGALVGPATRETLLGRMAELADGVPVYRLEIPWDFDRLPELTSQLWNWHETGVVHASAGGAR
jgi:hypothetical protein